MSEKLRLDIIIKQRYGFSREYSKHLINSNSVYVDNELITKASTIVDEASNIFVDNKNILKYVSRGGLKLEKAINTFNIDLKNKICIDVGASTGGFTDCMLQNNALKVYAVDVGTNQLSDKLINNKAIISIENTNIKDIRSSDINELCHFASIDVSFISLTKVIPYVIPLLVDEGEIISLIKPQFEAGRNNIGKKGIVKDFKIHKKVIQSIYEFCSSINIGVLNLDYSPIKGGEGNIEYLIYLKKDIKGINEYDFKLLSNSIIDNAKTNLRN